MLKFGHAPARCRGLAIAMVALAAGAAVADPASSTRLDRRSKYRYSFEYYRNKGVFGRPGERLNPNDPRGHMSHGHGGGHL